jgi:hypothetical protein
MSLNTLSISLSNLGHREDALTAIQEAVDVYQQLAIDQPIVFNSDLTMALNDFSGRLFHLGYQDDLLERAIAGAWQLQVLFNFVHISLRKQCAHYTCASQNY